MKSKSPKRMDWEVSQAAKDCNMSALVEAPELHPDTDPEAIAAAQRREVNAVLESWLSVGVLVTPEELSAEVVLPVSIVVRRLSELGWVQVGDKWVRRRKSA